MREHDAAISCVNYWHNVALSKAAIERRCHFCDLGGNNYVLTSKLALTIKPSKPNNIIPDCGLAPGMVSILAMPARKNLMKSRNTHSRRRSAAKSKTGHSRYQLVFFGFGRLNQ